MMRATATPAFIRFRHHHHHQQQQWWQTARHYTTMRQSAHGCAGVHTFGLSTVECNGETREAVCSCTACRLAMVLLKTRRPSTRRRTAGMGRDGDGGRKNDLALVRHRQPGSLVRPAPTSLIKSTRRRTDPPKHNTHPPIFGTTARATANSQTVFTAN